ncbi:hypothetical protein B7R22_16610 [Subtercola boreus]|uniref:Uncharacterized protein n=1 Tax=Subtercola boreus TaxID=120213 RepID=A0A3E0VRL8_9MICO|nr:hypothetical protein B7R22_16610 [Subtercola boreus]
MAKRPKAIIEQPPGDLAARCHRAAIEGRWGAMMRFSAGPPQHTARQAGQCFPLVSKDEDNRIARRDELGELRPVLPTDQ